MKFEFHPELLQYRADIMEVLAEAGYRWLSAFMSIDIDHSDMFLEVDGVPDEDTAWGIAKTLADRFPWGVWAYRKDWGAEDWVVMLLVRGKGFSFGGRGDGRPSPGSSVEAGATDSKEQEGDVKEEPDGSTDGLPVPSLGGLAMQSKPLAPEEMLRRFSKLLEAFTRPNYIPQIEIHAPVRADGGTRDPEWDGMVKITVRLSDVRATIGQVRQIVPLLKSRTDLLDLLAEAILVTKRDRLDAFLAELPATAAERYELLAMPRGVLHHGLTILQPSEGESWRLAFLVHASAVSEVLDEELQRVAAEGAEAMDKK
jgi:hypothetical protein